DGHLRRWRREGRRDRRAPRAPRLRRRRGGTGAQPARANLPRGHPTGVPPMSAQTGIELPTGPASQRVGDRLRYRVTLWRDAPNPLWLREMRQAARLTRTPLVLMVLTVLMTLLMATIGALMSGSRSPAEAGTVLFHVYFSLAYFVVTMV